jgi:hypothetical protein
MIRRSFRSVSNYRAGSCSGNALFGGNRFDSRPGYPLSQMQCSWILSVPPGKFRDSPSIRPQPLPSTSCPIHYLPVILPFDAYKLEIMIEAGYVLMNHIRCNIVPPRSPDPRLRNGNGKNEISTGAYLVEALCHKPEGRGFKSR